MPTALVIGTDHAFQRHQDFSKENRAVRNAFAESLQREVHEKGIDGIAEEAGDDREVWEHLRAQDAAIPEEWRALFSGTEVVDAPQPTIARSFAEVAGITYADVRAIGADRMTVAERDEAMAQATAERFINRQSILIIVGEEHGGEMARILQEKYGWTTESRRFP
ncbi:MAG TPA: hypothetical protein VE957_09235 [Terriglobales bacterium]|nr:hypothetical protein [Terriglobales bacterium]